MSLFSYKVFLYVIEYMSFRKAAEALNITPSAVSHCISGMEKEFGFPLFTRRNNRIWLTNEAKAVLPHVKNILLDESVLNQAVEQIQGFERGTVKLGCFNSVCTCWMPRLYKEFSERYPGIEIELFQGTYEDIARWLEDGTIDIGFLSVSSAGKIPIYPLYRDRMLCVVPKDFRPLNEGFVTIEELRDKNFVHPAANCDADSQILLLQCGFEVHSNCHVVDDMSILTMVQSGVGVCILPKMTIESYNMDVDVYPVFPEAYRVIGISSGEGSLNSPVVRKLYEMIIEIFAEIS